MLPGHEMPPRAGRSGFVAAFLSLLFPGLGHAYLGAYRRGLGFAAPPILLGALIAGIVVRMNEFDLAGMVIQTWFLTGLFIANLVALAYRAAAIVDSWAIAQAMGRGLAFPKAAQARGSAVVSVAGLAAVLLVMSVVHVAVARYDLLFSGSLSCVFGGNGAGCNSPDDSGSPGTSGAPGATDQGTPEPSDSIGPETTATPGPEWNGKDRLNILLIGADEQEGAHNTDTMIVVSIDPTTNQVVMFSLPRDTVDVPLAPGPMQRVYGSTYGGKINSLWVTVHKHSDWFPNIKVDGHTIANGPGYSGLMSTLANLYQIPGGIQYFVEVNFRGFKEVVDDLGGVTINVEVPVLDDNFPLVADHRDRLYIPTGPQHMDGTDALQYARSRHGSSDFDRGARQQRVLVALRRQANIEALLPKVNDLLAALSQNVRTNIPRELIPQLMALATRVDTTSIRSVIFTPPFYQTEVPNDPRRGYVIEPNVFRIRQAVKAAFTVDPNFQQAHDAIASEGAQVWVLNGTGQTGEAANVAGFLDYLGIAATAPSQKPPAVGSTTIIRAYNGADEQMPLTLKALEQVFGVKVMPVTDASVHVDFIVVTARNTPDLTPPPQP
jgi:LCP family protein required for cell wall assembly